MAVTLTAPDHPVREPAPPLAAATDQAPHTAATIPTQRDRLALPLTGFNGTVTAGSNAVPLPRMTSNGSTHVRPRDAAAEHVRVMSSIMFELWSVAGRITRPTCNGRRWRMGRRKIRLSGDVGNFAVVLLDPYVIYQPPFTEIVCPVM